MRNYDNATIIISSNIVGAWNALACIYFIVAEAIIVCISMPVESINCVAFHFFTIKNFKFLFTIEMLLHLQHFTLKKKKKKKKLFYCHWFCEELLFIEVHLHSPSDFKCLKPREKYRNSNNDKMRKVLIKYLSFVYLFLWNFLIEDFEYLW